METYISTEYLDRMRIDLGKDFDKYIESLSEKESHGFTINLKKLSKSSIDISYIENLFDTKVIYKNDNFAYLIYDKEELAKKDIFIGKHPLYHAGLFYIQEPSAAEVLYEVNIKENDTVLDLCASPGGKSIEALYNLDKKGILVSNEIDKKRVKMLLSNIERMGFDNVVVTNNSSADLKDVFSECFDIVIVDAPCSGEGMMRKNMEARKQWSKSLVSSMSKIQKKLLMDAYDMLKIGGTLVYSTCTFSKEEDEENVEFLLKLKNDLKLIKMKKNYPFNHIGEGQFYAIFEKVGEKVDICGIQINDIKSKLNVLRYDVKKEENVRGIMIPNHAATHIDSIDFEYKVELDDLEAKKYLHGDEITKDLNLPNTFVKITYKNLGLGVAKYVNGKLKNHYPKGLRNM